MCSFMRRADFFSTICFEAGTIVYFENGLALDGMTEGKSKFIPRLGQSNF